MAGPADCLEGVLQTVTGPGMGVYWQPTATPDAVDQHLRELTGAMTTPGKVTVFVRGDKVDVGIDPALRNHLHRDSGLQGDLQIKVVDREGGLVTTGDVERSVANALDLPVASTRWAADRIAVDDAGRVSLTGTPSAYLVLPDAVNAQRRAAVDALAGNFASVGEFMSSAAGNLSGLGADSAATPHTAWHALGAYLTAIRASGASVPAAVTDLLRQPMLTAEQLAAAIGNGADPQPARPDGLADHLLSNPGDFALVIGGGQIHTLAPGAGGGLEWLPPGQTTPVPFETDGATDRLTELLEQPEARVLVLNQRGVPQQTLPLDRVPAAPPAAINPPTGTTVGPQGQVQVGAWPDKTTNRLGLDTVNLRNVPTIMVDARFPEGTKASDPVKYLQPRLTDALTNAGFRHFVQDNRPLIISTADTPQVRQAAESFGGVVVYPVQTADGMEVKSSWKMHVPGSLEPVALGDGQFLTQTMVNQAVGAIDAMPALDNNVPPVLKDLLSLNSYSEAQTHWSDNFTELRAPTMGEALGQLSDVVPADRWFNVMRLTHAVASNTEAFRSMPQPIEPTVRNSIDTERALPGGTTADLQFVFDFLTSRELAPLTPGTAAPGPYQTRLLWDGLLFRMMLGRNLSAAEAMVLINGVNADDYSRAVMDPARFDAAESHAAIFAAIHTLEQDGLATLRAGGDGVMAVNIDWEALKAQLAKCPNGADRAALLFRFKNVLQPHLEDLGLDQLAKPSLGRLNNLIYLCH
ncbi:hypothetical protein [Actinoplanes sp. NPDC051494]|uniref:hypothetical protein n=1 Tax=Actinoplanes sp. NPDC051494 TaxID=3363907 RepID=UPI0037949446